MNDATKKVFLFYGDTKVEAPKSVMTGLEIKQLIHNAVPSFDITHSLVLEGHGSSADTLIGDNDPVDLTHGHGAGGPDHFYSKPPTNFG